MKPVICHGRMKERKRRLILAIGETKKKRVTLQNTISSLEKDIMKYSIEVEEKQSFALLTMATHSEKR